MSNLLNKKCPVCGMELKEGKDYPQGYGKKFCSENCKEEYAKKLKGAETKKSGECGCC